MSATIFVKPDRRAKEPTRHGAHIIKEVICRGGALPGVTQIAVAELPEGPAEVEPHRHPTMWECYFILEGEADYHVGGEIFRVSPGDFLAVPPDTLHNQVVTKAPHRIVYWGIAIG